MRRALEFSFPSGYNEKALRAAVIRAYMGAAGIAGAVCFSCGNASRALRVAGVPTIDVSPRGDLIAGHWWTPGEIARTWPHLFDATSGHLPVHLMVEVAREMREKWNLHPGCTYLVPTGSGETITCLRWAFPGSIFKPVRNTGPATRYEPGAPLNFVVGDETPPEPLSISTTHRRRPVPRGRKSEVTCAEL